MISAPFWDRENLAHSGCRCAFTAAGPPSSGLLPLRPRERPRYSLVPTSICRLIVACVLLAHSQASEVQLAPQAPSIHARPFCVGRSLRRARRPPKAPPRATKGRLEPRTAPPVPGLRESYRGELRGTRTQTRITPHASASAPRPTAPARTASRSLQQTPPPPPIHKMAAGPLRRSAFQKGRDGVVDVTEETAQAHRRFRAISRKLPGFVARRALRTSPASGGRLWRWNRYGLGLAPHCGTWCKLLHFFKPLRKEIIPTSDDCFEN